MTGRLALSDQQTLGVMLVVISAIVFSFAGIFTKGVDADGWSVIFWRGLFAAAFTIGYVAWRGETVGEFAGMGKSGVVAAIVGASGTAAFLNAFKITSIANVALIWASAPLFAALICYAWIGERLSRVQIIACCAAFLGVGIIVQGSLGTLNLRGDLLAVWMVLAMSLMMAIYRRWPETPAAGPAALSSILLLPFSWLASDVLAISARDLALLAAFGLFFAIASVTMMEGVRRINAGEAALLGTLETPLAPILAFFFFQEIPGIGTFIGGTIILAAVLASQICGTSKPTEGES